MGAMQSTSENGDKNSKILLRKLLCRLYPDDFSLQRVCDDTGISSQHVTGHSMVDRWHSAITIASNTNLLQQLIRVVLEDYPENQGILDIRDQLAVVPADRDFRRLVPPATSTVPEPLQTFVGRTDEINEIRAVLDGDPRHLAACVVCGLSGAGKSQVGLRYAEVNASSYSGIYWIRGSSETAFITDMASLAKLGEAPGYDPTDEATSARAAKLMLQTSGGWLLIIDDAMPERVRGLLPRTGAGHILITSTSPSWSGLTTSVIRLRGLAIDDAIAMLTSRSGQDDEAAARRIAEAVERSPLALEQVAAYVEESQVSLSSYEFLLERRRTELLQKPSSYTDYPETVYSAFTLTLDAVNDRGHDASALLACLAYLQPDSIPRWLARSLISELMFLTGKEVDEIQFLDMVSDLQCYSLVTADTSYLSTHSLIQAFIREAANAEKPYGYADFVVGHLAGIFPDDESSSRWSISSELIDHVVQAVGTVDLDTCDRPEVEALVNNAGMYLNIRGRNDESLSLLRSALAMADRIYSSGSPNLARGMINLATALDARGQRVEAQSLMVSAIGILEHVRHPDQHTRHLLGIGYSNLGSSYLEEKKTDLARKYFRKAQRTHAIHLGKSHYSTAIDTQNLGRVSREEQKWEDANRLFDESLHTLRKVLEPNDFRLAAALHSRASARFNLDDSDGAIRDLREALTILDNIFPGMDQPLLVESIVALAKMLHMRGAFYESLAIYKRAIPLVEVRYGKNSEVALKLVKERNEAATKAILPLIAKVGVIWSFETSLIGTTALMDEGRLGIVATPLIDEEEHEDRSRESIG